MANVRRVRNGSTKAVSESGIRIMSDSWISWNPRIEEDRKSTRLNSSHTEIYTLSLHDALPIYGQRAPGAERVDEGGVRVGDQDHVRFLDLLEPPDRGRSEEHTSELQSHRDLHSFPTRRSSDLWPTCAGCGTGRRRRCPSRGSGSCPIPGSPGTPGSR